MTPKMKKQITIGSCVLAVLVVLVIFYCQVVGLKDPYPHSDRFMPLNPPLEVKVPSLASTRSGTFDIAQFKGHWSLLFFGFTRCPDVCPTTLAVLSTAYRTVLTQMAGQHPDVVIYFVSIDPENDQIEAMQQYLTAFDKDFVGITGRPDAISAFQKQFGIYSGMEPPGSYSKMEKGAYAGSYGTNKSSSYSGQDTWQLMHGESIVVLNPEGKWHALIAPPHFTQDVISDLNHLLHKSNA